MIALPIAGVALPQLLRRASPMLPVGAYAYSQGMEWAVEEGVIRDEDSALAWISDLLRYNVGTLEAPVWRRLDRAWQERHGEAARHGNERFGTIRQSAELRAQTIQMGGALKAAVDATRVHGTTLHDQAGRPTL